MVEPAFDRGPTGRPPTPLEFLTAEGLAPTDFRCTETGNAALFARLHADDVRFDHRRGKWLLFRDHRWVEDDKEAIQQLAKEICEVRYLWAPRVTDTHEREHLAKWAIRSESFQRLRAMLRLARSEPAIADSGDHWNKNPWALCVRNGVVDLRTGKLRSGKPEEGNTFQTAVLYDPDAACSRWERFLDEVFSGDRDLLEYVHRAIGYTLTGLTSEQCLFLCYGTGSNGKTTFLGAICKALGDYAADTPFATLELRARSQIPNDMAALVDRRFVTASETSESARLNEARIKILTGGDPVTARFLHHEFFTYVPTLKLWLAANHLPRVRDMSVGFWRRVQLITFDREFEKNGSLEDDLAEESVGILAWAIRGCSRWQEHGLEPPGAVVRATDEYRRESDPLEGFLGETCVLGTGCEGRAGELRNAYVRWCEAQRLPEGDRLGSRTFGAAMKQRFGSKRASAGIIYLGVGLKAGV